MGLTAYAIPRGGGLNLGVDSQELGALGSVDQLNIDLDVIGTIRTRDGFLKLNTVALTNEPDSLFAFTDASNRRLLVGNGNRIDALSIAGASVANVATTASPHYFVALGDGTNDYCYISNGTDSIRRYFAGAFTSPGGLAAQVGQFLAVTPVSNRLMIVGGTTAATGSTVVFSDAGLPETITAANFIRLDPGDGEMMTGVAAWRELVFVFKGSKFWVYTGESVSGTGTPIFNFRKVSSGIGCTFPGALCVGTDGVYFVHQSGIYKTTGGSPVRVSGAIDSLFEHSPTEYFQGGDNTTLTNNILRTRLWWHNERLHFGVWLQDAGVESSNNWFILDGGNWLYWQLGPSSWHPMATYSRTQGQPELMFASTTGGNNVYGLHPTYTTDNGSTFASRYQSGNYEPSPGAETATRHTKLWGSGTPTLDIFTDHATSDPLARGGAITLGTAPAVAKGYHSKGYFGTYFSHKLSSTSGLWSVNRVEHDITFVSNPQ